MSEYIEFKDISFMYPKKKTKTWMVVTKKNKELIGNIKWYPNWRQYVFEGDFFNRTLFSIGCLEHIVGFIKEHKNDRSIITFSGEKGDT